MVDGPTGLLHSIAGNGDERDSGDGGPAVSAGLSSPSGVVFDAIGNIFITDFASGFVREIDRNSGNIRSLAKPPRVRGPIGLAVDKAGSLYVADGSGRIVLKIASVR